MKIIKLFIILIFFPLSVFSTNIDSLFTYDESKVNTCFEQLNQLEEQISNDSELDINEIFEKNTFLQELSVNPFLSNLILAPWNLPSFWFAFVLASVGTYTIYLAGLGPLAYGIVYLSTKGEKTESRKALWGFITGTIVGAGVKIFVMTR